MDIHQCEKVTHYEPFSVTIKDYSIYRVSLNYELTIYKSIFNFLAHIIKKINIESKNWHMGNRQHIVGLDMNRVSAG